MDEFYSCFGHGLSWNFWHDRAFWRPPLCCSAHAKSAGLNAAATRMCFAFNSWSPPPVVPRPNYQWIAYTSAGYAAPSFAVHCAAMAGVPPQILERASQVTRAHIQVWGSCRYYDVQLDMSASRHVQLL